MKRNMVWVMIAMLGSTLLAEDKAGAPDANAVRLLKEAGAVSYSHKADYGSGIDSMYLGYDKDNKAIVGVAFRETKTYKKALTIVSVTLADGKYKVAAAEIPDVATFHGKSQTLTRDALKDVAGKVFEDEKATRGLVDGITGATKYREAIYVSFSLMTSSVIKELKANPAWPRLSL